MSNEIVITTENFSEHMRTKNKLYRLKIFVSILAIIQVIFGSVGFSLFQLFNEEYLPRFKNHMEPLESKKYTLILYSVDVFMGIWLIIIWKPATIPIRLWIITTIMFGLLTTISFFWAIPYGYSTSWQSQLLFDIGLIFRILQVGFVRKFYFDYISSRDEIFPFVKTRVVNTWPARRPNSDIPISVIPID